MRHIDWTKVLAGKGPFTDAQKKAATFWCSCAVGEARRKHPKAVVYVDQLFGESYPQDSDLSGAGYDFYLAVQEGNRAAARRIYRLIQERVAKLGTLARQRA